MNKFLPFIFLTACGVSYNPNWSDMRGVVDQEMIDFSIINFERSHLLITNMTVILDEFNKIQPLNIQFVPRVDNNNRGMTFNYDDQTLIYVRLRPETGVDTCMDTYYVLQHELLHYIAPFFGYTDQENAEHTIEPYFLGPSFQNGTPPDQTVEFWLYINTLHECQNKWAIPQ